MTTRRKPAKLNVRNASPKDVPAIIEMMGRAYRDMAAYTPSQLEGQMANFPEGQFLVEYLGAVVGYAATFRIDERTAMGRHTWSSITGGGYAARHDPNGDWLYGMEVCVDAVLVHSF